MKHGVLKTRAPVVDGELYVGPEELLRAISIKSKLS